MTLEKLKLVRDILSGLLLIFKDKGIEADISFESTMNEPRIVISYLKKIKETPQK